MILCGSVKGLIKREFEAFVLDADTAIRSNPSLNFRALCFFVPLDAMLRLRFEFLHFDCLRVGG